MLYFIDVIFCVVWMVRFSFGLAVDYLISKLLVVFSLESFVPALHEGNVLISALLMSNCGVLPCYCFCLDMDTSSQSHRSVDKRKNLCWKKVNHRKYNRHQH